MRTITIFFVFVSGILNIHKSSGQILAEAEGGLAFSSYNEIRIPGEGGTTFDASKELGDKLKFVYRLKAGYRIKDRHNVFVLFAPLKLRYDGSFNKMVLFNGRTFLPTQASEVVYQFNSYRLTYRYDFLTSEKLRIGLGLTAKIRDAYIQMSQEGVQSKKKNVGVVPLVNLLVSYDITDRYGILLEGDGLATGQGRAFDLQISVPIKLDDYLGIKVGYRVLEGGADNDEVYNFSWINYIQAGIFYGMY